MEKENLNVKYVGATIGSANFEEMAKEQKGITLIALIITIIIMLILVGVTVAAISDGGLFKKAKYATEQTEEKAIYEQIVGVMKIGVDGKIDVRETTEAALNLQGKKVILKSPGTVDEITNSATIEATGKNGKAYTYTITTEKIMSGELKFYGYRYEVENEEGVYYYFLENGFVIAEYDEFVGIECKFEKKGDYIIPGGAEDSKFLLSEDYSQLIRDGAVWATRDDNKMFKNKETQDLTSNIYIEGIYITNDNENYFCFYEESEGVKMVAVVNFTEEQSEEVELEVFVATAQISEDGRTVTYNNKTYYLFERIK